jgi:3',5'-cyclic AMP phosphodiesterase CpdA
MSGKENFYFVQFTDIHIGTSVNPDMASANLKWALSELETFGLNKPQVIICSGDSVCDGTREELEEFKALMNTSSIPWHALPANHDLWGEADNSVWQEVIGPMRKSAVAGNFKFIMWNDIKRVPDGWLNSLSEEEFNWIKSELDDARERKLQVVAAIHNPMDLRNNYTTHFSRWNNEDTQKLTRLFAEYGVLAVISGDYHVNDCWDINGVTNINSSSLAGFIWNGQDNFPVKPGYRIFHWDGDSLRTFWRNGSYWNLPGSKEKKQRYCWTWELYHFREANDMYWPIMHYERAQINLNSIGGVWTGGARPVFRNMYVFDKVKLQAQTFSQLLNVENVSWSLNENDWRPMNKVWNGIWEEWEADFDPDEFRGGEYLLKVRAETDAGAKFYDTVPVILCGPRNAPRGTAPVIAGGLEVRQAFRIPFD